MKAKHEEINQIFIEALEEYKQLPPLEKREIKRILMGIFVKIDKIKQIMIQDRCNHKPKEVDTDSVKYTVCKICDKILSDITSKTI